MRQGFIKVAALTPKVTVADTQANRKEICRLMDEAEAKGAKILVFPELCITGYTCGDLFYQQVLLREAKKELLAIAKYTQRKDYLAFVGLPLEYNGKLYNVAAAVTQGKVLGLVPKTHIPNYNEFYERRHFAPGMKQPVPVALDGCRIGRRNNRTDKKALFYIKPYQEMTACRSNKRCNYRTERG